MNKLAVGLSNMLVEVREWEATRQKPEKSTEANDPIDCEETLRSGSFADVLAPEPLREQIRER